MDFNSISHIETCVVELPKLLYYSHIPTAIAIFLIGILVFFGNKKLLASRILFSVSIFFSLWVISDLVLWVSTDGRLIMFFWSIINLIELLISAGVLYFSFVFLEKKDVSLWFKFFVSLLFVPFIFLMMTSFNLKEFTMASCEAQQGNLIYYFYILESFFSLWLISYLSRKVFIANKEDKKQVLIFAFGVIFFLFSFSGTNIIASTTDNWSILQYGLFSAPVFAGFLAFLIVRYKAFDIKLIGAQALVAALVVLIGSQFFFITSNTNRILTGITLALVMIFGWVLIRSVRAEIRQKEELQKISDNLAIANERLKELDLTKSEFISIASHQLRTPLTAIKGYISLLLEGSYGKVPAAIQDVLNKVYTVNSRLVHLVEDLLNVSRIEAGRIQYSFTPTQLEPLIAELVDMFMPTAKEKKLTLMMKLLKTPLPSLTIDPNKIKEVLSNLIDNALKYTKEGSVTVSLERTESAARIIVSDTGIGIKPEDKRRLFEKFIRSKETTKIVASGAGLGLYVGKNFVEAHGGKIWAESDGTNKGSRFIIELPLKNPKIHIGTSDQPTTAEKELQ